LRILLIHAEEFSYSVREKAIPNPEPLEQDRITQFENALVVFCTVEKDDERNPSLVGANAAAEIADVAKQVRAGMIVLYPYAHLSSNLAAPEMALKVLKETRSSLKNIGLDTHQSPFGYYKSFKITCLGHPLSELSRTVTAEKTAQAAPIETEYQVLDLEGKLWSPSEYLEHAKHSDFRSLVEKEALKRELAGGEPKFLDYCRRFGIEWEPYSDIGHMRYGPEAVLMFDLIADYSWNLANSVGLSVFQVKGTNMFDMSVRPVREHAELFGSRLYKIELDEKSFVLRYAACHQQFSSVKDWTISYRHLPFGTFEVADSYRLEQSGELLLSFRTRKLHMPDFHVYCTDLQEAKQATQQIHSRIYDEIRKLNRDYVSIYNITRSFFEANRDYVVEMMKFEGKPVLLNFVPENVYYWVLNIEYNIIDELERPREIGTVQIDVGNARRFEISYVDKNGNKQYPPIIHTAIIGSIERYLYTLFDTAARTEKEGRKPMLPEWVTPVQVRIIPVADEYVDAALILANRMADRSIRADVDDRDETVQKRVRDAEVAWISYVIVVGAKESKDGKLTVRVRRTEQQAALSLDELVEDIQLRTKGYPFRPLNIPMRLSKRPNYKMLA
jgi:threonyl-tRNA synthetase